MTTGARRSELCALRWSALDLDAAVLTLRSALYVDDAGMVREQDTKTHQQRRVALDAETVEVLRDHLERCQARAPALGLFMLAQGYVFSPNADGSMPLVPDTATQRFGRMAARLNVETKLRALRHYSATELIAAGVDVHTVAGRLGQGGGGATTLRVYAASLSESDQRAASTLAARMPPHPAPRSPLRS
ncbi:tyrosine-type recombinase/integrase [Micromonospora sp. BL4]|uniref:tyrosine-type recombinase/integrase n=1 Tax=Micromonospora sp. BL4 TaxID=2478710 RepID=UPI001F18AC3F|nr:tyrosine-type recombinase/integrase [Micromonospora sp. BL4]